MPHVTVGSARLPYEVHGEGTGPSLVLVPGTGPGSVIFDHLVPGFTEGGRRVVQANFSGSAHAQDDGGELTLELLAEQVIAVLEEAGNGPVDLLGFSLGSLVSATVAATRPDLVNRLVLVNGWAGPGDQYLRNMMTVWRELRGNSDAFGRYATITALSHATLNAGGHDGFESMLGIMLPTAGTLRHIDLNLRADIRGALARIQARTLVIGSTLDLTIPVQNAREVYSLLANATYAEIASGHGVIGECAEEFTKVVRDFLAADAR
ncbi:alpha/beta fold hydrolase [Streptomyces sp. NPDC088762]|uniref:alpha/beta fold hydrolase n=1 Tax=Streptomyces sp. NPDC088762 TaxID=3365891 RepID=UPI00380D9691